MPIIFSSSLVFVFMAEIPFIDDQRFPQYIDMLSSWKT